MLAPRLRLRELLRARDEDHRKGATPETNERSLKWDARGGYPGPIPNQMMGFPDEDFRQPQGQHPRWNRLGLNVKPFFATPYPGTEWYYTNKQRILDQYDGDLEAFSWILATPRGSPRSSPP